jgi:hypothetical protein
MKARAAIDDRSIGRKQLVSPYISSRSRLSTGKRGGDRSGRALRSKARLYINAAGITKADGN